MSRSREIEEALKSGRLRRVSAVVEDPGNEPNVLALVEDTRMHQRYLVGSNGTPNRDGTYDFVTVPVDGRERDPLKAVAKSYDDPHHPVRCNAMVYSHLMRRT